MSQELFDNAELSFAAYATLSPGMQSGQFRAALELAGFSETQARRFAERYRVVDQYTNTDNGLSVTFFERLSGNPPEQIIAIRGTEFGTDFINDVVIADILGIGNSPDGRDLAQYQSLRWAVDTWLNGTWLRPGYSIAGHSLGGYLGGVLAGDPLARANQAYLYNAPGTMGLLGPLTHAIASRFGLANWNAPNATEIEGSAGLSLIAGIGQDFSGNKVIAEIESQTNPFNNHSIVVLTDALAVYATYSALAPSLTEAQIGQLLKSASNTNKGTLESALDALRKLLLGANVAVTSGEDRDAFYTNLYALQATPEYLALAGSAVLRLTATQGRDELATKAKSDFGHFLAVKYLLPVALEGSWGVLGTIHTDLYAQWQADQALTSEQRKQGQANFTDEYLSDRAAFLTWKNKLALADADASTSAYNKGGTPDAWFRDNASGLTINLGNQGSVTDKSRYIFGAAQTAGSETLSGGNKADRLYGGGGNDVLYGFDQNDYLEGNAGDDQLVGGDGNDTLIGGRGDDKLYGGAGDDTYVINSGDGHDHIVDSGRNYIQYNGKLIAGTFVQSTPGGAYQFIGEAGSNFSLQFNSPGVLTLDDNTSITFDDYTSAEAFEEAGFGIELVEAEAPAVGESQSPQDGERDWDGGSTRAGETFAMLGFHNPRAGHEIHGRVTR